MLRSFMARTSRRANAAVDGGYLNAAAVCAGWFASPFCFDGSEPMPDKAPETAVFFVQAGEHLDGDLAEAVRLADRGTRVICVALDTPAVLENAPENAWHILAWQYQQIALDAVRGLLDS